MLELAALIVGTLTTALIALIVYVKNKNSITHWLFIVLAACLIGWSVTTYLSLNTSSDAQTLFWIKWIMLFVVAQNTTFFLLVQVFPDNRSNILHRKRYIAAIAYSLLTALVAISPFLFARFEDGAPQPGPGMALFLPHALIFAVGGIVALIIKYHRSEGLKKIQLRYFLAGTALIFTVEPIGNFIMPIAFKSNALLTFSPLYAIVFSGLIAYAITTKRLFDIRAFVVRAAAYITSIILLSALYIIPSLLIVAAILQVQFTWTHFWWGVVVATIFAVLYNKVRTAFNDFTNKIFFRGYYEPQDILNQLSEVLVRSIDADYIKHQSIKILQEAVKTRQFTYWLAADPSHDAEQGQLLARLFKGKKHASNVLMIDEQDGGSEAMQQLRGNGIALAVRLRTTNNDLGFLTLGFKESGEIYNERDQRLLSIAADEIAIALQNAIHFREIQNFNRTLQGKVAEATKELRRNNEKLRALDETKDDFISMASHQLRTPLTSVKGYLSMVLEGDAGKLTPTERKMLAQAYSSSQRMVYLISDLLNVSRLKTGKFIIEAVPVNLAEVITSEVEQLKETAQSRSITLEYVEPHDFPSLMLDETKTRQVIMNFVDNAIYYTPAGGHIKVILSDKSSTVELRVEDDGIGVPKSEQHHLFTKFYRAPNARRARPDGTGLGLFMAKKVIVAQSGALIFESQEGKGSTFGFTFSKSKLAVQPLSAPATPEAAIAK